MAAAVSTPRWRDRRRRVYQSIFHTDISHPTPHSTPSTGVSQPGQPFGEHFATAQLNQHLPSLEDDQNVTQAAKHCTAQPPSSIYGPSIAAGFASPRQNLQTGHHFPSYDATGDQFRYDRAWHIVTSRIALPSSVTAEDSFGTLPSESQYQSQGLGANSEAEFVEALRLVVHSRTALPRAAHTEDVVFWHTQQARTHFSQHVLPLLFACADELSGERQSGDGFGDGASGACGVSYEKHMAVVMSSVRTLEAALRLYSYGMELLVRGIQQIQVVDKEKDSFDARVVFSRFRRDIHALVGNSASQQLMRSLRAVIVHLVGNALGVSTKESQPHKTGGQVLRPSLPTPNNHSSPTARKRLLELLEPLHNVGLADEKFQILFAEVMDDMMARFVKGAYAGVWIAPSEQHGICKTRSGASFTSSQPMSSGSSSPCITSLCGWIEKNYAPLAHEVLSLVVEDPKQVSVTVFDVKTYQSLALGRLAALRISELFDIVLAWPKSRGALDDLRASITTPQRRVQLTDSFSATLHKRLLHPGRSTLEILQTYIAMIRTFHALDHSKVLLSRVSPSLQLYLCGREDAVRIVVTGLLASPEEIRAARREKALREDDEGITRSSQRTKPSKSGPFMTPAMPARRGRGSKYSTPSREDEIDAQNRHQDTAGKTSNHSNILVELALLLTDPVQSRRAGGTEDDADLDWDDMTWVPDPIDAGANYKRPRSEDVIGTLISSLGSQESFIREFQAIVAERLLSEQGHFEQEIRVLNLLKKRFGEAELQSCDVMIRDIQDSRLLDGAIRKVQGMKEGEKQTTTKAAFAVTPTNPNQRGKFATPSGSSSTSTPADAPYHARILSRLFWPSLEREHFLLPTPIVERQKQYEQGYEQLKSTRKLTWLNQLGQATVELELQDRTVSVDCRTYEATVIYAFQDPNPTGPARRTLEELVDQLQMDDDLIASALSFWVSKGVLARRPGDVYVVLETASSESATRSSSPAPPVAAEPAAVVDEKETARRQMYWQYIRGMLTNSLAVMPLSQMSMMMKMLVTDGFPWSNEELQEFLGEKVAEGEMEIVGGKYKLVRK